ncbi:Saf4/Yju2 family protein [Aspergillus melleus]|uniref:Saf4/Yju2 family protein n=1 Tax=Aspergillus melleus TaxID=138277 RepID=UPI001E8ECA92|nr:Protein saf4 [Aspergillus melleus]KAH8427857.1 Protein saf4 [Aspergillus melleus]
MPFAVWCTNCKPHETIIGQGVRFNAEKKKVGNYYSTPIYSFRMKHTACGGWIEIRTDPQNTAYVVTEGGRKRDTGEEKDLGLGEITIKLRREEGGESDPLAKLEGKVEDKRRAETEQSRLLDLQRRQNRDWEDPYEQSRRLRRGFRAERKVLETAEAKSEALKDKMSLGIDLVDETEEDRLRAGFIDFGPASDATTRTRPMFDSSITTTARGSPLASGSRHGKRPKAADLAADRKAILRSELTSNTRAAVDPFLSQDANIWQPESKRRKTTLNKPAETIKDTEDNQSARPSSTVSDECLKETGTSDQKQPGAVTALVAYASDSD